MRDPRRAVTRGLLAVLLVAGCGDNAPPAVEPLPCRDPCAPFSCDGTTGTCFLACSSAAQCAPDHACTDEGRCTGTECTTATTEVCAPYACIDGTCATDCAAGPCTDGYYCRGDTDACVPLCTRRGDPTCDGYLCDLDVGECEPLCVAGSLECAAGYRCEGDRCVADLTAPVCSAGCGAYACVEALGRCATSCVDDADCASPATCTNLACG